MHRITIETVTAVSMRQSDLVSIWLHMFENVLHLMCDAGIVPSVCRRLLWPLVDWWLWWLGPCLAGAEIFCLLMEMLVQNTIQLKIQNAGEIK